MLPLGFRAAPESAGLDTHTQGRCWDEGMFLVGGEWQRVVEDVQKSSHLSGLTDGQLPGTKRMVLTCRSIVRALPANCQGVSHGIVASITSAPTCLQES